MSKKLIYLSSLTLFMLIFLQSFFHLLYNERFYQQEFEKNHVQIIGKEEMTYELFRYFRGEQELGDEYFNEKERMHLVDVKDLIDSTKMLYYYLLVLFFILIYFQFRHEKNKKIITLNHIFRYTGFGILIFSVLSFTLKNRFTSLFVGFHHIFFNNDLWLLDPSTDVLINLFPERFFMDFVFSMYVQALVAALLLLVFSFVLQRFKKAS